MQLTQLGFILGVSLLVSACSSTPVQPHNNHAQRSANPASLNCLQHNGRLEIRQTPQGEYAECILPSGKRCEEWEMFRGNCPVRTVNANMRFLGL